MHEEWGVYNLNVAITRPYGVVGNTGDSESPTLSSSLSRVILLHFFALRRLAFWVKQYCRAVQSWVPSGRTMRRNFCYALFALIFGRSLSPVFYRVADARDKKHLQAVRQPLFVLGRFGGNTPCKLLKTYNSGRHKHQRGGRHASTALSLVHCQKKETANDTLARHHGTTALSVQPRKRQATFSVPNLIEHAPRPLSALSQSTYYASEKVYLHNQYQSPSIAR